jgi:hypothetical protein
MEINMNVSKKLLCITVFIISGVLSGCSNNLNQVQSGFLGDYSKLKKSDLYDNTKVFHANGFDKHTLADVTEIKIVPFEIWINPDKKENLAFLNPQRLQELSVYFHQRIKEALQNDYRLVDVANSKTLTIQGAFSNIKLSEPELSVTDFIPVRLVLNAGNSAYLKVTNQKDVVTEVSIEVEFLFGETQKRVFAMTATKNIDLITSNNDDGFTAVAEVLDLWIEGFVRKLASVRQPIN